MILLPISLISIVTICLILGALIFAYIKKLMMTYTLIIINFIVFIISIIFNQNIVYELGFQPAYLSIEFLPQLYTLFTSMFLHGDFLHILMNMLIFFFIGIAFERRIGKKRFIIIYLLTGICGAIAYSLINIGSTITLIGASGAIFGVLGAFAASYPRDEVIMPIPIGIMFFTRMKVITAALMFAAIETIYFMFLVQDNVAHIAHIGGLISGVILAIILIRDKKKNETSQYTISTNVGAVPSQKNEGKINLAKLRKLATTEEQKKMLEGIENETVPEVRDAWLERFFETIKCPNCNMPIDNKITGKFRCKNCGYSEKYY